MTVQELLANARELREKVLAIVKTATKEGRDLSEAESTEIESWKSDATKLEGRAKVLDEAENAVAESRKSAGHASDDLLDIGNGDIRAGESERDRRASFNDFLCAVYTMGDRSAQRHEVDNARNILENQYKSKRSDWTSPKRSKETRDLAMNSGITGGYLMPTVFYEKLMAIAAPMAIVRPRAMILPMNGETIKIPSLDQTTAQSAGVGPYFGGVQVTWTGENASISSTQPGFRQTTITMHELTGYMPVGRSLIKNSPISVEALVYQLFGQAIAFNEDYAFFNGNGVSRPLGLLVTPARIQTADRGSASAITFANAQAMYTRMPTSCRNTAIWLGSQNAETTLLGMTGTSNTVMVASGYYVTSQNPSAAGLPVSYQILGRPLVISEMLPALNTDGDFNFFDLSKYIVADGGPPEIAASEDYLFRTNEMAFRVVQRVGGSSWLNNALTLTDGTTTQSPFVSLGIH